MSKPILAGVAVVLLAAGVGGYALTAGAPAAPKGGCPALVSLAPYAANFVAYGDMATLRNSSFAHQLSSGTTTTTTTTAAATSPLPQDYQEFIRATDFHIERDLDHVMLEGSIESAAGGLILEGRFDQEKISSYVAKLGSKTHYDSGDVYLFPTHTATGTVALMFLNPNRIAITMGKSAETQALILADTARRPNSSSHEEMCERAGRVSGAPFFMVGDIPKSGMMAMAALSAGNNGGAADLIQSLEGWDFATWTDHDNLRMEFEGEYASRLDALKARIAFEKVRSTIQKAEAEAKSATPPNSPVGPAVDSLVKNFGVALDGRYLRLSTSLSQSDLESLQRAAAAMAAPASPTSRR
jgi:hypothetical protein